MNNFAAKLAAGQRLHTAQTALEASVQVIADDRTDEAITAHLAAVFDFVEAASALVRALGGRR